MFSDAVLLGVSILLSSMVAFTRGLPSGFIAEGEADMNLFESVFSFVSFLFFFSRRDPLLSPNSRFA
jgi:hypothetical protein